MDKEKSTMPCNAVFTISRAKHKHNLRVHKSLALLIGGGMIGISLLAILISFI